MLIENMKMAFSAIRSNKMRSALTMLGIIIGIAAVIAMMAVGGGAREQVGLGERAQRTARGDFVGLGGEDLGQLVHLYAIQQLSSALASPLSIASAASSTPSVSVSAAPAMTSASAELYRTASR